MKFVSTITKWYVLIPNGDFYEQNFLYGKIAQLS